VGGSSKKDCRAALDLDRSFAAEVAKQMAKRLQSNQNPHPYNATEFESDNPDSEYSPSNTDSSSDTATDLDMD
jgi:hypothetical protein